jgi:hypothetical protein
MVAIQVAFSFSPLRKQSSHIASYFMFSTPPGNPAFTRAYFPLLAPPFDDSDGLQSNARFGSYSTSTKPRTPQVGLGLLFGDSDFLPHLDRSMSPAIDPLLDSPQLLATKDTSPPEPFRLDRFSVQESSFCASDETDPAAGAVLDTSSSAFSIRDWIIQPSSSPVPSDALSRPPTPSPHLCHVGSTHNTSRELTDPHADVKLLGPAFKLPGFPANIDPAVLAVSQERSPLASARGSRGSVFLQVVEHLYRRPPPGCLSPGRTSSPGGPPPYAPEVASAQSLGVTYYKSRKCAREPLSTPMNAPGRFTGVNHLAFSSALVSPQDKLSSNNDVLGPSVSPDTPLYNMHQGVSEYDLQRRVNRYRRRYPGKSLDRHWLSHYAGKLNKDGKAIEEYRCYISGCAQLNKRRDHIIVHICSHVNERPFACCHWYSWLCLVALTVVG